MTRMSSKNEAPISSFNYSVEDPMLNGLAICNDLFFCNARFLWGFKMEGALARNSAENINPRVEREAKKRQRELERRLKEAAKLSELEQARIAVDGYENELDVLLSIHKESPVIVDWLSMSLAIPPMKPARRSYHELKTRQRLCLLNESGSNDSAIEESRAQDDSDHQKASKLFANELEKWQRRNSLAKRILCGETSAYLDAISEFNPFSEISSIGSSIHFTVHSPELIAVVLKTKDSQVIPAEAKSLTSSGKLSVKPLAKARFAEIYQDYVCASVIRVARELFALLPLQTVLITTTSDLLDTKTGKQKEQPFLSVAITRSACRELNFEKLDPSDTIQSMHHRGDLKLSRKNGGFETIDPLTSADLIQVEAPSGLHIDDALLAVRRMRENIKLISDSLNPVGFEYADATRGLE